MLSDKQRMLAKHSRELVEGKYDSLHISLADDTLNTMMTDCNATSYYLITV